MNDAEAIRHRYLAVRDHLDERQRRVYAAAEATIYGIATVSRATGIARSTIGRGLKDLRSPDLLSGVVRRTGAGRRSKADEDPTLIADFKALVEPATMGDPMRPLLWVSKSWVKLSTALKAMGHVVSPTTIPKLLDLIGYRRQVNRKTREGGNHPDRDAQFEHINTQVLRFQDKGEPAVSVDTKKKELIGDFKNGGSDYRPEGCADQVRVHDFKDKNLGKAVPHGIYDITANEGWVTLGIDHDTAEFAVNSLRCWYVKMGIARYPNATSLLITVDGGGSNGSAVKLWKRELQAFADETGLAITVCHYPPGTSKWNKIEHKMFCHISQNWRGKPLTSRMAIVELIGSTTTTKGLTIQCELDTRLYDKGIKVTEEQMKSLNIERHEFHPEWNYTIRPNLKTKQQCEAIIDA